MRSIKIILLSILVLSSFGSFCTIDVGAKAAVLMDATTGRVLYAKNENAKLPMASTTKIMTAILAVENCALGDVVTIPKIASGVEGSSMYLAEGEKLSVEELLQGLLLKSGNDAAVALAVHISGSVNAFVDTMNVKALEIGALNTVFCNPNGLPNDSHYTTAYDLALMGSYAMKKPDIVRIANLKQAKIKWEGNQYDRVLQNKNKLLTTFDGANGLKTGFTKDAGKCFVGAAKRDGMQLVGAVLNSPDMFNETAKLLQYGFNAFAPTKVVSKGDVLGKINIVDGLINVLEIVAKDDIVIPLSKNEKYTVLQTVPFELNAPVNIGDKLAKVDILINDKVVVSQEITANSEIELSSIDYYLLKLSNAFLNLGIWASN